MDGRYVLERAYPYSEKIRWAEDEFKDVVKSQVNDKFKPAEYKNEKEIGGGYRTVCHFQLEVIDDKLTYMIRDFFKLVPLKNNVFPPADVHIQQSMAIVLEIMNAMEVDAPVRRHLSAIRFLTDSNGKEIHLTLFYTDLDCEEKDWIESTLFLHMALQHNLGEESSASITGCYKNQKYYTAINCDDRDHYQDKLSIEYDTAPTKEFMTKGTEQINVIYKKPLNAFQHPNVVCMHQALKWLLRQMRLLSIQRKEFISLLELYGGYGAHTIALGAAKMAIKNITMVELDARLSRAAMVNVQLNKLDDRINVITGDAANQTLQLLKETQFDTLLVDPPRQGLTTLIPVIQRGNHKIKDIFYVSCCLTSLRIDLEALCVQNRRYRVKSWCTTDLVPQSDDVECLVHLERLNDPDELKPSFVPYRHRKLWSCCARKGKFVTLPWYISKCLSCGEDKLHPRFGDKGKDLVTQHNCLSKELVILIKGDPIIRDLWNDYTTDLYDRKNILWKMAGPKLYSIHLLEDFLETVRPP